MFATVHLVITWASDAAREVRLAGEAWTIRMDESAAVMVKVLNNMFVGRKETQTRYFRWDGKNVEIV